MLDLNQQKISIIMKKFMLLAAVGLFAGTFTSCKKDYTCECRLNGETAVDNSLFIPKSKKDDAEAVCKAYAFDDETCTLAD